MDDEDLLLGVNNILFIFKIEFEFSDIFPNRRFWQLNLIQYNTQYFFMRIFYNYALF